MKWLNLVLLIVTIGLVGWPLFISGPQKDGRFLINGGHDTLWHLSLVSESAHFWPLQFPGMANTPLHNYHFLADFVWGQISKVSNLSHTFVYFKLAPFVSISLVILGIWCLCKELSSNRLAPYLGVATVVLAGSAAYQGVASRFMFDHFIDQSINVHTILGYAAMVWSVYFLHKYFSTNSKKYGVLSGVILGLLFSIKSLFFIPLFLGVLIKPKKFFLPLVLATVITFCGWKMISGQNSFSSLAFKPFWISTQMIENYDRYAISDWVLKLQHYQAAGNPLREVQILLQATIVLLIGGVWLSGLGIVYWKNATASIKSVVLVTILISLTLPFVVAPNPDHFNTVQFAQPSIFFLSLGLGIWLSTKSKIFIVVILLFLIPTSVREIFSISRNHNLVIGSSEMSVYAYLRDNTKADAIVLAQPVGNTYLMQIPALAGRRTYASGEKVAQLIGVDFEARRREQNMFLDPLERPDLRQEFLDKNSISYLIFQKSYYETSNIEKVPTITQVYENSDYIILRYGNNLWSR